MIATGRPPGAHHPLTITRKLSVGIRHSSKVQRVLASHENLRLKSGNSLRATRGILRRANRAKLPFLPATTKNTRLGPASHSLSKAPLLRNPLRDKIISITVTATVTIVGVEGQTLAQPCIRSHPTSDVTITSGRAASQLSIRRLLISDTRKWAATLNS